MADTLEIFGVEYTNVAGIIATNDQSTDLTYIRPQGTKSITQNGTGIDVAEYASVDVNVSGGAGAISVVDTQDSHGGTIRTITAVDISDTTAVADDVAQGKYFYTADGTKTEGTSSGGGGGLEYETGTWTPSEDINITSILFANTHTVAPTFFMISDVDPSYSNTTNSVYNVMYYNFHQLFGVPYDINNAGSLNYGYVYRRYRSSSTALTGGVTSLSHPYTDQSDSLNTYPRYWVTETGITAKTGNSEYYRAGRTYKWTAVWAPTA